MAGRSAFCPENRDQSRHVVSLARILGEDARPVGDALWSAFLCKERLNQRPDRLSTFSHVIKERTEFLRKSTRVTAMLSFALPEPVAVAPYSVNISNQVGKLRMLSREDNAVSQSVETHKAFLDALTQLCAECARSREQGRELSKIITPPHEEPVRTAGSSEIEACSDMGPSLVCSQMLVFLDQPGSCTSELS